MPNELSILEPRVLNGVVQAFDAPEEFLGLQLVGAPITDPNPTWEYDIVRPSRGAHLIHQAPNGEGTVIDQIPFGHMQGAYAYFRLKKIFNATTLRWLRAAGENEVAAGNATKRVTAELEDIRLQIMRAEEVAVWNMLQGSWTYTLENGGSVVVNYQIPSTHTVVALVTDLDTNNAGQLNFMITQAKRLSSRDSGFPLTNGYMNSNTMQVFIDHPDVAAQLSESQKQTFTAERMIPRFNGMNWIEYDGGYVDASGNYIPYIPAERIVCVATGGGKPFWLQYGPAADLDAPDLFTGPFSKSWVEKDPSGQQILMELNYMPVLAQPNKIVILDTTVA